VLHPRPTSKPPIPTDGVSVLPVYTVRSAHIFVSGFLKGPLPALPLPPTTLHVTYHETGLAR